MLTLFHVQVFMAKLSLTIEANEIPIWSQFRWRMKLDRNQENSNEKGLTEVKFVFTQTRHLLNSKKMLDFSRDFVRSEGIINSPDFDQVMFESVRDRVGEQVTRISSPFGSSRNV